MRSYRKSEEHLEQARKHLAGGVGSTPRYTPEKTPPCFERGAGSRLYDVDGNEYIDYVLAWGPLVLGHCPKPVTEAVKRQLDLGTLLGGAVAGEDELAAMVSACMPSVELLRFTNSGSEAVHIALRLARAFTGKEKVLKFEGGFHGWFDNIFVSCTPESLRAMGLEHAPNPILEWPGQPKSVLSDILVAPFNNPEVVERIFRRHGHEIAAVITEPVLCNCGVIPPAEGFLQALREITRRHESLLVFDETITGFRAALGGAQGYYGVAPDLTVFGKGVGGGYPIAGYGGAREIMDLIASGKLAHQGTYNSNSLCVAAARATLTELARDGGAVYDRMRALGNRLMEGIAGILTRAGVPNTPQGLGTFFSVLFTPGPVRSYRDTFTYDRPLYTRFWTGLLDRGVRVWPNARGLWYISAAHTEEDIAETLTRVEDVAKTLRA